MKSVLLASVLIGAAMAGGAGAQPVLEQAVELDPRASWQVLETAHFEIAYPAASETDARRVAALAEETYARLALFFGTHPAGPIRVVIAAHHEIPNGYSVPFPYNQVQIFLTAPRPGSLLAESRGDWMKVLLAHELTHTFHLDQVRGFPKLLRRIFGRAPDLGTWSTLSPAWLVEGLGTWSESAQTGTGRVGGALSAAILRRAVLSGRFDPIDRAATYDPEYPGGDIPYVYGSHFVAWLARARGPEKLSEWVRDYSKGPIPFAVDLSARRVFGKPFAALWKEWQVSLTKAAEEQARAIEAEGLQEGRVLLEGQGWTEAPRATPEGKILFYWLAHDELPGFYLLDPATGKFERRGGLAAESVFSADGKTFFGTRARKPDAFSYQSQIATGPWPGGPAEPLPGGEGGREGALSPDGKILVFVRRVGSGAYLAKLDLGRPGARAAPLTPEGEGLDYANPIFLPGGEELIAGVLESGRWRLWKISASTGARLAPVLADAASGEEIHAAVSPDGKTLCYSSDATGVYNLYLVELVGGRRARLTNTLGAALWPTFLPDGKSLAFTSYDERGLGIRQMEIPENWAARAGAGGPEKAIPPLEPRPAPLSLTPPFQPSQPSHSALSGYEGRPSEALAKDGPERLLRRSRPGHPSPGAPSPGANAPPSERDSLGEPRPYTPWSTLPPRFWLPQVAQDANDVLLGAWTADQDLLRHWFYSLSAFYGTTSREPRAFATLGYSRLPIEEIKDPLVFVSLERNLASFGTAAINLVGGGSELRDIYELRQGVSVGISSNSQLAIGVLPLLQDPEPGIQYSAGYTFERRGDLDGNLMALAAQNGVDPGPFRGSDLSGFFAQLGYSKIKSSLRAISPELGIRLLAEANAYHESLGSDFDTALLSADARAFVPVPFLSHHVIALRAAGGWTVGERPLTRAFVLGGALGEGLVTLSSSRLALLRGYEDASFAGDHYAAANAEYRLPVIYVRRGWRNFPLYLRNLSLSGFVDSGTTWDSRDSRRGPRARDVALGAGAELVAGGDLFYYLPLSLRVGGARSLRIVRQTLFYAQIGRSF